MLDVRELNAKGVRARQALDVLRAAVDEPKMVAKVAYAQATFSNLMRVIEQELGVAPGYFGSSGALLQEINPFDGNELPAAVSMEPPPAQYHEPQPTITVVPP